MTVKKHRVSIVKRIFGHEHHHVTIHHKPQSSKHRFLTRKLFIMLGVTTVLAALRYVWYVNLPGSFDVVEHASVVMDVVALVSGGD